LGARRSAFEQRGADLQRNQHVGRIGASFELALPGEIAIGPGDDGVLIASQSSELEAGAPAVVAERSHLGFVPVGFADAAMLQQDANGVVPIGESVGFDDQLIAEHAFDGKATAVDLRTNVLDDGPAPAVRLGRRRPMRGGCRADGTL
jgi:hypothetical protein